MSEPYENLIALAEASCRRYADRPLFGTKRGEHWQWTTYREFQGLVDVFRAGLAGLGVVRGDRVGIVSNNRVEWAVAAYATYGLGAIFVPMYEAQRAEELKFILCDCGAKVAIAATATQSSSLQAFQSDLPALTQVLCLDAPRSDPSSYQELLARGRLNPVPSIEPAADDIAAFIYTSGTTGRPKGVMLSHGNLTSNIAAVTSIFPLSPEDRTLSFLPWAHAFGQVCELDTLLAVGASTAINDDVDRLVADLGEVKPTILLAVPRIWNELHASAARQIAEKPAFVRALFRGGLRAANKRRSGAALGSFETLGLALADKLIFSKIRAHFGGRLRYALSGSAALRREVAEFIDALGIEVYEGYGLTETSPVVTMNRPRAKKLGSVGQPIPGVRLVIDRAGSPDPESGEVVVYGPNVMKGYYNRPDENSKTITPDGGLRTGDLGRLDSEGFLQITGRTKEQYKLANGKYVIPAPLEEQLKLSPYVDNVMLFGDNKPFNVAIVIPNVEAVRAWARRRQLELPADIAKSDEVASLLRREIANLSKSFRGFEKPRDILVVAEEPTTENGLLTPTLKLKRDKLLERCRTEIEALYAHRARPAEPESVQAR